MGKRRWGMRTRDPVSSSDGGAELGELGLFSFAETL